MLCALLKNSACVVGNKCSFSIMGPRGPSAVVAIAHLNQVTHFLCVGIYNIPEFTVHVR